MQREIKFRAWDKKRKEMFYVGMGDIWHIWEFAGKTQWSLTNNVYEKEERVVSYENGILMQFTGLKDKNGVEIYEGDIVIWEKETWVRQIGKPKVIKWFIGQQAGFNIGMARKGGKINFKVIGNIYENPNLLKNV